ncbi:unnamed protein product [Linum tenue]|uniref:ENTH domain-containing protein n=1 Tax=Linum tenue TaxID=586396 RepID=A0AAV0QAE6_9ROSI|nr:unnamed protein product [Linum tenue]
MKKVFGQTVRDLKREVNKKVLKVPGIEQKVLDATSNEPWGPHGTLLAEIAQATRNYHEYQMIMSVIWKRINDTGKNWRHVYKGLTVLEYLVAHGSERVIDDIKEHAYQISTLSDFQYIDSSGRDQGSNVRKKSQNLVVLVNDKERIIEVRQKAAANRERFRSPSAGGMYRPGSHPSGGYGERHDDDRYEGRYGSRDEERNGYGRENSRDDDRYSRYDRDGNRDEERYGRDGYRDDDYRGRSRSNDGYGSRGRSSDRDRDRGYDDDGQYSSRGGARGDDQSQDGRPLERKFSEQNIGAPPSYEEAVNDARSPTHNDKNGETSAQSGPAASSPSAPQSSSPLAPQGSQSASNNAIPETAGVSSSASPANQEVVVDEFDPRGSFAAFPTANAIPAASTAPTTVNNAEMDLLGSLSESFGPLAIVPASSPTTTTSEAVVQPSFSGPSFTSAQPPVSFDNQGFEDPFGETPFKAVPSSDLIPENSVNPYAELPHASVSNAEMENSPFGDAASSLTYSAPNFQPASTNSQFLPQELSSSLETDILADILPASGPSAAPQQAGFPAQTMQASFPAGNGYGNFNSQTGPTVPASGPSAAPQQAGFPAQTMQASFPAGNGYGNFNSQTGPTVPAAPNMAPSSSQFGGGHFLPQGGSMHPTAQNMGQPTQYNNGNFLPQPGYGVAPQQMPAGPSGQLSNGNMFHNPNTTSSMPSQVPSFTPSAHQNTDVLGGLFGQGSSTPVPPQPVGQTLASQPSLSSSTGALVPVQQPSKDKFETKSTVWADTLNRGLVNLNISGSKINPLSDIGIDFDAINRKEKRMEKQPATTAVASTITMGKAMGSGSGVGRAAATGLRPPSNQMMAPGGGMGMGMGGGPGFGMGGAPGMGMGAGPGPGMGMGGGPRPGMTMVGGPGSGMGMGGYGAMPQQPMGMGIGGMGMNMGMNMGMGQGPAMQQPQHGSPMMPGGYNNMMGAGGYPQQPYGGRGYQ